MLTNSTVAAETVPVHFSVNRGNGLRGDNNSFTKIAFVSKAYFGKMPKPGENWLCSIVGDTAPGVARQGALLLRPLRELTDSDLSEIARGGQVSETSAAQQVTEVATTTSQSPAALLNDTPESQSALVLPEDNLGKLRDARNITVKFIENETHTVTLRPMTNSKGIEVLVNGNCVGLFDDRDIHPQSSFPRTIKSLRIRLSNGKCVRVCETPIRVISKWQWQENRWVPMKKFICLSHIPLVHLNQRIDITWSEAQNLRRDQIVAREYTFQWQDDALTNGIVSFPRVRPHGTEWNQYPIPAVPAKKWKKFLQMLEGKLSGELQSTHIECIESKE